MSFTKISLIKGKNKSFLEDFKQEVIDSLIDVLKIPSDDRNIFLMEYEAELFEMKEPYEYLIEIAMFSGRSNETKKLLFKTIVDKLNVKLDIKKESIFIFINEQPLNNWGVRGGKSAEEIDLEFKVDI